MRWFSAPYSLVHTADAVLCSVPSSITTQNDNLIMETTNALMDRNSSTCMQPFADNRAVFQVSLDYHLNSTASLDVWLSGKGIHCEHFVIVYFEKTSNYLLPSKKTHCPLIEQTIDDLGTNTDCVFRCYSIISLDDDARVTLTTQSPMWGSDFQIVSRWCDLKITRD